jgi:hypothetical protein
MRGRMQGVFTVVVTGGPRLGDLRAGAMAAATGLTIAWSGSAALCLAVVVIIGVSVRSFWHYQAAATTSGPDEEAPDEEAEEAPAGDQAEDSRRAS